MRQRVVVILSTALAVTALWAVPAAAATHDDAAEQRSFDRVNAERVARGLPRLVWDARMAGIARDHSRDMASDGDLRHNDSLPSEVGDFEALGENVGYGADADAVHDAFMDSSSHRRIIVGERYLRVGVGAVRDGDLVWITQVFYTPRAEASEPDATPRRERTREAPRVTRPTRQQVHAQTTTTVRPVPRPPRPVASRSATPRTLVMLDALTGIDEATPGARPAPRVFWI